MTKVILATPTPDDASELLAFELANRAYFESWINARDPAYYQLDAVKRSIDAARSDCEQDQGYQHLVRTSSGIVGRVNLSAVTRPYFNKASLGYRIGQVHAGKGYAVQAVQLVLAEGFSRFGVGRVEAMVRPDNLASARVLERNAFTLFGRSTKSFVLQGVRHDLLHFECHAPSGN